MKKIIHCPWCGSEMSFALSFESKAIVGGRYECSNTKCFAMSPLVVLDSKHNAKRLKQKTYAAALRRVKRSLKPLPPKKLYYSQFLIPCWLEERGDAHTRAVLLDRDSVGFFAKYENSDKKVTEYYMGEDYNKKWRCWRRNPSVIEIKDAPWEDEIEKA